MCSDKTKDDQATQSKVKAINNSYHHNIKLLAQDRNNVGENYQKTCERHDFVLK